MKFFQSLMILMIAIISFAFINKDSSADETLQKSNVYIKSVQRLIKTQYPANFKSTKVRRVKNATVNQWLNRVYKIKGKALSAAIQDIIAQIQDKNDGAFYLLENVSTEGKIFDEVLIARLSEEDYKNLGFSSYMVTNRVNSDGEDPCSHFFGEDPPGNSFSNPVNGETMDPGMNANSSCQCLAESRTDGECGNHCESC